ncbi:MAG: hypothetical protein ACKVQR_24335 [Aquabacterium sp.]
MFRHSRYPPATPPAEAADGPRPAAPPADKASIHESSLDLRNGLAVRESSLTQLTMAERAALLGPLAGDTLPGRLGA